jgi:pimeloyl-ACP methyl ester carboxylesterase
MFRAIPVRHQLIPTSHPVESQVFVKSIRPPAALGTMVYIHGLGESSLCFEALAADPTLACWTQILPDLPGYGRSAWLENPLRLAEFADLVGAIAGAIGTPPLILIGHSMGGVIGQLCVEGAPGLWDGFVNIEGNISLQDCTFSSKAAAMDERRFIDRAWNDVRQWVYELGIAEMAARRYFASLMFADPRAFHLNGCELVERSSREDFARRFSGLSLPSLFIAGLDGGAGHRSLQLLEESNAKVVGISGAGHWPFLERKEEFLVHLTAFLDSLPKQVR